MLAIATRLTGEENQRFSNALCWLKPINPQADGASADEWELYDRKKDPREMKNVYNDPAYADIAAQLHQELKDLRVKYKDSPELDQKYIDIYTNRN